MAAYTNIVLLVLTRWENPKKPGTGYELRVIHVTFDGRSSGVGVERVFFKDGGAKTYGRPLMRADFSKLKERWDEVLELMEKPPPVPKPEPMPATPPAGAPMTVAPLTAAPLGSASIESEDF